MGNINIGSSLPDDGADTATWQNRFNGLKKDGKSKAIIPFMTDEHGNFVQRTKAEHPYSYDGFVTWFSGQAGTSTTYTDRIGRSQQDFEKCRELSKKHFGDEGDVWTSRPPEKVQAFLRDLFCDPSLKLTMIMEYCNWGNGYPVWRLDYVAGTPSENR